MKSCFFALFTLVVFAAVSPAQPPDTMWTRAYGRSGHEDAYGVAATSDGGFFIVGGSLSIGNQSDVWLVRINSIGDTLWTRNYGGGAFDQGTAVRETSTGGAIIAARTQSFGAGSDDIYLIKTNSNGDTLWTRTYGTTSQDLAYGITSTMDGGYAVCGSQLVTGFSLQMVLMKFSATDELEWTNFYGETNVEQAYTVFQTADGGYLLGGRSVPPGSGRPDMYVVRTNIIGDTVWTRRYGNDDWEEGTGITEAIDGGCVISGWKQAPSGGNTDFYVVKTDNIGTMQWQHTYGGALWDRATTLRLATDGGYIVGGTSSSFGAGGYDFYFVKLNTSGDTVWTRTNGGTGAEQLRDIQITSDGGYMAVGVTATVAFTHGGTDFYAVRLPGFSGVGGFVRDEATNNPVPHVWVGAIGQAHRVMSDQQGYYVLTLPPGGVYDVISYGACVGRDTVRNIEIFQDSITVMDLTVGLPVGLIPQTSINIVANNRVLTSDTLHIYNDGLGVLDFTITVTPVSPPSGTWLSTSPAAASIEPGDSMAVAVNVLSDTTDDGVYDFYGFLTIHMNSCPDSAPRVDVIATILDADDAPTALPKTYALAAYPNPFNPSTTLAFDLPQSGPVDLVIYDVTGREVRTVLNSVLEAGRHQLAFDASDLPSGIYFARLTAQATTLTHKLLLLK